MVLTAEADFKTSDIPNRACKHNLSLNVLRVSTLNSHLNLPGRHNVLNALAAIAVASELKVSRSSD